MDQFEFLFSLLFFLCLFQKKKKKKKKKKPRFQKTANSENCHA
jgi:hypothetical protein